jgi:streptomycin 6-kinase
VLGVPEHLEQTAASDPAVRAWLGSLPQVVAGLARQWALSVGEPFEPGGHFSWTAPATGASGADLVLKVAFGSTDGEERDEAAGLRFWAGNGAVRLLASCASNPGYGLLLERCMPGTSLERTLPGPEQDVVVAALLRRLWACGHDAYAFRPLTQMCAAWARERCAGVDRLAAPAPGGPSARAALTGPASGGAAAGPPGDRVLSQRNQDVPA